MFGFNAFKQSFLVRVAIFGVAWVGLVFFLADWLSTLPTEMQFMIGLSGFVIPAILAGTVLGNGSLSDSKTIRTAAGLLLFSLAVDLIAFPLLISTSGEPVESGGLLVGGSSDLFLSSIFSQFGLSGNTLFFGVYIVGFLVLMVLAVALLNDKQIPVVGA